MGAQQKRALYDELTTQLAALLKGESDPIANAANTAALVYHGLPDLNWAGFYVARPLGNSSGDYPHPFPPPPAGEGDGNAGYPSTSSEAENAGKLMTQLFPSPLAGEGQGGGVPASGPRELVLGPFQGKPACVRIPWGKGVCGTAAARGTAAIVPDVHEFPGHITLDPESRSELFVPPVRGGDINRRLRFLHP